MHEAEALGELVRDQRPRGDVVDQQHELDVLAGARGAGAHRHVVGDHRHLGLEIDAPVLAARFDRIARADEAVGGALVHQRVGPEALGQLGAARLAHQLDVRDVGRAVQPLVRARQRRRAGALVERLPSDPARLEAVGQLAQPRLRLRPASRAPPARSARSPPPGAQRDEIARDDDQTAVAPRLQARELHRAARYSAATGALGARTGPATFQLSA